jgi:lipoprotein-anchoring transpeptidase ErfK/SrfK
MGYRSFVIAAAAVVLLLGGAVAVYAYDASRDDVISDGVTVGGIDVGGKRESEARAVLRRSLAAPLERPVVVEAGGRRFRLTAARARLRTDVEGMVREALDASRDGNVLSRAWRGLTGGELDEDLPARVTYSRAAVDSLVRRVKKTVDRPAQNATASYSATTISVEAGHNGLAVRGRELGRRLRAEIVLPNADRVVKARTKTTKPKVTRETIAEQNRYFIGVERGAFKLRFFKNLKLAKTYTIAVGQVGFDTPTGLYHIQNKAVNPAWNVPNKPWAGELAGRVIPGGSPENPLKARWMGIFDGAGIHGTDAIGSLGSAASHGCIRMAIPDVMELYNEVPVQTPVYIG